MFRKRRGGISLTELERAKLMKLKLDEEESWVKALTHDEYVSYYLKNNLRKVQLDDSIFTLIQKSTATSLAPVWFENFITLVSEGYIQGLDTWLPYMDEQYQLHGRDHYVEESGMPRIPDTMKEAMSIWQIPKRGAGKPDDKTAKPLIAVAAGPSIREHDHIKLIAERGFDGVILATDRMLKPLVEAGIHPENGFDLMVASVDGHRFMIAEMYEDLEIPGGPIPGLFCTTVAPQTARAAKKAGVDLHWFHGMQDAMFAADSVTGAMNWMMACPSVAAGGNVGATCFTLGLYLYCNPIIYIGLDLGYTPDTRYENTAYYDKFVDRGLTMDQISKLMTWDHNPDTGKRFYQDPVFFNYRRSLSSLIQGRNDFEAQVRQGQPGVYPVDVINATEGGSVWRLISQA